MKVFVFIFSLCVALNTSSALVAQETSNAVVIKGAHSFPIHSNIVNEDYQIDVYLPSSYESSKKDYPVVYLTDSHMSFPQVATSARLLKFRGELPEIIIVGIGYKTQDVLRVISLRSRDLTPVRDMEQEAADRNGGPTPLHADVNLGGAKNFIQFINKELKPLVNKNYRTDISNETYAGYSYGGLFGLYVMFNHTDSFDNYILGSPSAWQGKRASFDYEVKYAKTHKDLDKGVFLSAGSLEQLNYPAPGPDQSTMISDMEEMYSLLKSRNYPHLKVSKVLFDGETHMSAIGITLSRGMRAVLAD